MDQQLVIKFVDASNQKVDIVSSSPILYSNFKTLFKQHIFSDKAISSEVELHGYGVFEWAWPPVDLPHTLSCDDVGVIRHSDGVYRPTFVERAATEEEINERTKQQAITIRLNRNFLLAETDYTQLPDSQLSENKILEFVEYRKILRDLPNQQGFPWNVIYPTPIMLESKS